MQRYHSFHIYVYTTLCIENRVRTLFLNQTANVDAVLLPIVLQKLDASSQLALIDDLHRDIRSAATDVKGQHLPGFCLPKKVRRLLPTQ